MAEAETGSETLIREGAKAETAVDTVSKSSSKKSETELEMPAPIDVNETVLLNETLPFNETVINKTLVPNETILLNETLPLNETLLLNETLANGTALANETDPIVYRIGDGGETSAEEDADEEPKEGAEVEERKYRSQSNARVLYEYLKSLMKDVTGGAPEPAKPPVNVSKIVEEELSDLDLGQITFNVSQEMTLGVTERVEVEVSKDIDQRLRERLKAREELQGEDVNIETYMETSLKGTHFYIKSKNLDIQAVEGEGFSQWVWEVTPLKGGDQNLSLAVLAVVEVPEWVEVRKEYPVFEEVSEVEVSLPKMVIYILDQVSDVRRMVLS